MSTIPLRSQSYVIASGKGGSGKSTLCAGLASALALSGHRVIMMDADFGMRNLDIYTGLCEETLFDLNDYLEGRRSLKEVLTAHPQIPGLFLLAAPVGSCSLIPLYMKNIVTELSGLCDFLLIDAPAGIGEGLTLAAVGADHALVVSTPDQAGVADASVAADRLKRLGVQDRILICNRVKPRLISRGLGLNLDEMIDRVGLPIIGYVREDDGMIKVNQNMTNFLSARRLSPAARDIRDIARRLCGESVSLSLK